MPTKALAHCTAPNCSQLVPSGTSRCPAHEQRRERDRRERTPGRMALGARGRPIDYYQTREWRLLRDRVLSEEPFCRHCQGQRRTEFATVVDHIIPRSEGGSDERSNLQGLCARHHSAKTVRE